MENTWHSANVDSVSVVEVTLLWADVEMDSDAQDAPERVVDNAGKRCDALNFVRFGWTVGNWRESCEGGLGVEW